MLRIIVHKRALILCRRPCSRPNMAWTNSYQPPLQQSLADLYGPDPYDVNFPFPVDLPSLENDLVKLTPFIPRLHTDRFWDSITPGFEETMRYMLWSAQTKSDLLHGLESLRCDPHWVIFAVVDKTQPAELGLPGALAGMIGLLDTVPEHRATEIGAILTLPRFRRSFITSNAVGLLLHYCLEPVPRGIGLRRVAWHSNSLNAPSIAAARRMGFRHEGVARWQRVLPKGKTGKAPSKSDPVQQHGRDTDMFSICWDDWVSGGRDAVELTMKPR